MKTKITMLLALLLALVCTAAYAQEYYTLPEIREQAAQGWHETYTDKYGRTRQVDIDIEVFGEERAPWNMWVLRFNGILMCRIRLRISRSGCGIGRIIAVL